MNIDPVLAQFIITAIVAVPVYLKMRSEWMKSKGDAYESLSTALRTSGQTIDDLFKMLSDVPKMRAQLDAANEALEKANNQIAYLVDRDSKREAAMRELQANFDRDALLRANVEEALRVLTEKNKELTRRLDESQRRISALEDELDKRDKLIAELKMQAQAKPTSGFGTP
jgi:chromosome segregation ATPase